MSAAAYKNMNTSDCGTSVVPPEDKNPTQDTQEAILRTAIEASAVLKKKKTDLQKKRDEIVDEIFYFRNYPDRVESLSKAMNIIENQLTETNKELDELFLFMHEMIDAPAPAAAGDGAAAEGERARPEKAHTTPTASHGYSVGQAFPA